MTAQQQPTTDPPPHWECDVVLRDGGTVHLRPARQDDVAAISRFFDGLTETTTYYRFFSPRRITTEDVERMVDVDQRDHVALLAELGSTVIGLSSYDRLTTEHDTAEVAFIVEEDHQGRGLGTLMLEHLAAAARERGITAFTAEVLAENSQMLEVFRLAGFTTRQHREGSQVEVSFLIEPTEAALAAVEGREHRAEASSVGRLLFPGSVAVIGASRREHTAGHQVVANLTRAGFGGAVYPVNPGAAEIAGLPAHPSVTDIPGPVDLAVIAVPAESVMEVVRQCADKGVQGVVVLTAGFSERGEGDAQRELRDLARRNGMRVVGPNCIGLVNTAVGLDATFSSTPPHPGNVAMMSQSGAVGIALLERSRRTRVGISSFVSVGNKADLSGNDLLQFWEDDPATDVILLYLESFGNPHKFARIARRVSRRKPIVAVKSGRTVEGSKAASSHTAAVTSSDTAVDALFDKTGVIRVDTLEQQFDVALLLASQPLPRGRRLAIVGNSGGPGILAADACAGAGLVVQELGPETIAALREIVDPNGSVENPVDLIATADAQEYAAALDIVLADEAVDAVLAICTPTFAADPRAVADVVAERADADKPVLGAFLAWPEVPKLLTGPDGGRVPLFGSPESAIRALGRAVSYATWRSRDPGTIPDLPEVDEAAVRAVADRCLKAAPRGGWLDPLDVEELLTAIGIALPADEVVDSAQEAAAATELIGGPVALKALGPELVHKSDVGGVVLDLETGEEAAQAFTQMRQRLGDTMDRALVQKMAEPGVETIIGVTHDRLFGPVVVFGLGGVATELMRDHAFSILPLTDRDAAEMVRAPRSSPLLFGYRGTPLADTNALEGVLQRIARLAAVVPELAELDLNPVLVSGDGVAVVDARAKLDPSLVEPPMELRRTA